jgi:hypothetical protein
MIVAMGSAMALIVLVVWRPWSQDRHVQTVIDALDPGITMTIRRVDADPMSTNPAPPDLVFAGFPMHFTSTPIAVAADRAEAIRAAMITALRRSNRGEKGCIPDPGYLVFIDRVGADGRLAHSATASFCFRCDVMDVVADGVRVEQNIEDEPELKTLVVGAAPGTGQ